MGRFSDTLMDHFNAPRNVGRMDGPDRVGIAGTPGQGPFMVICLKLAGTVVAEARYQTHGCGVTVACGSMITELIKQRPIDECLGITPERLSEALDGVPADKAHAPVLAVAALRNALENR